MKSEKFEVKDILKRAKLLMEYDTRKTHDENLRTLEETNGNEDERIPQDPAMDSTKCAKWNESQAPNYYRNISEALNIELGVPDIMFQKLKTEKGGTWGETTTATLDKEVEKLEDYLDLSYNPFGDSFEASKILSLFDRYADYAVLGTDENGASKWFPACEYIRMQYIIQTDGENLAEEIDDPSGWTDAEEKRTAENVEKKIIYCYKNWMRALQKFNRCPPFDKQPPPPPVTNTVTEDPLKNKSRCIDENNFASVNYINNNTVKARVKKGVALMTIYKDDATNSWNYGTYEAHDGDKLISTGVWKCEGNVFKPVRNRPAN